MLASSSPLRQHLPTCSCPSLPRPPWEAATHHFFQLILNLPMDFGHLEENIPWKADRRREKQKGSESLRITTPSPFHSWGARTGGPGTGVAVVWELAGRQGCAGGRGRGASPGDATQRRWQILEQQGCTIAWCLWGLGGVCIGAEVHGRGRMRGPTFAGFNPACDPTSTGISSHRHQLPLAHPPWAQAEAVASMSSPCVLGHGVEGGVTVEGRTPWLKTRYGQQSPNTQHPKSTLWYRSSRLGHTQQLPPMILRATAHTHQVSTKDLPGQMAHFLLRREWVWNGQCGLNSFHWQVFAKQALTTHCGHMEEGTSLPSGPAD